MKMMWTLLVTAPWEMKIAMMEDIPVVTILSFFVFYKLCYPIYPFFNMEKCDSRDICWSSLAEQWDQLLGII